MMICDNVRRAKAGDTKWLFDEAGRKGGTLWVRRTNTIYLGLIFSAVDSLFLMALPARSMQQSSIHMSVRPRVCCWASGEQACSGAGTRWNAVVANILEPERRSGKYRWPQVER